MSDDQHQELANREYQWGFTTEIKRIHPDACSCGWTKDNLIWEANWLPPGWGTMYFETSHGDGLPCKFCPLCGDKVTPELINATH